MRGFRRFSDYFNVSPPLCEIHKRKDHFLRERCEKEESQSEEDGSAQSERKEGEGRREGRKEKEGGSAGEGDEER